MLILKCHFLEISFLFTKKKKVISYSTEKKGLYILCGILHKQLPVQKCYVTGVFFNRQKKLYIDNTINKST